LDCPIVDGYTRAIAVDQNANAHRMYRAMITFWSDESMTMTSKMLEWKSDQTLAVGKGATVQQYVASLGSDKLEISVAPWGEGHLRINGREIAHVDGVKDRRQAFRAIKEIAERYVETHMLKSEK